jgi:hypothetical protein
MAESNDTLGDVAGMLARARAELVKTGAPALVAHLDRLEARQRQLTEAAGSPYDERYPLALVGDGRTAGAVSMIVEAPCVQVPCFVEHLVVSADSARAYTLEDLKIGRSSSGVACQSLPLETFSVEAYALADGLMKVQTFRLPRVGAGTRVAAYVAPTVMEPPTFRAILWVRIPVDFASSSRWRRADPGFY